uniref:Prominin 1a n=1 Tax=Astyanax mexicanus TaxID=7994 RepID=A0A8B9HIB2_ASTMX
MLWRAALALGLVLLLLPHTEPRAPLDFGLVPGGVYDTVAHYEPGPIGLLFNMVHAFLHVVQPNPFPEDLVIRVAKDKFGAIKSEYQKVRGCQKRACDRGLWRSWYPYGRRLGISNVYCCLFSHLVHRAGVLCAYAANQHLSSQLKNMRRLVNSNLRDLHTFANDTPAQIDYLISQYGTAKEQVLCDLDNVGVLLGGKIHDELGKEVRPALDGVLNMAGVMRDTKEALENVSVTLETLQEGTGKLQFNLSVVRAGLSNALSDPACADALSVTGDICQNIRSSLAQLEISANYSRLPGVTNQLNKVNDVLRTDLSLSVQKGLVAFNDTPTMVTEQTRNVAEGVRNLLDGIGKNISSFSKQFPIQSSLNNFTVMISHTHSRIEDYYPEIDQIDFYRWICCIALCCMVVLILAFNFLGLLCGILGFDRHASPTTRGCVSNTGGNLLMAGVGFSFLFSWLLMGVVTATFLVGGNVEKLVCEPFSSRQLFKVLDTPHLVNPTWRNFIPGYLYNDPDMDLTVENLYSNCKENRGIYSALHLDKVFNVSALLNTSVYTKEVSQKFEGVRVDLRSIILLDAEGKQNLISFTETGIGEINFAAYLEELNKGVTRVDLLSYANNLDAQADQLSRGSLQTSLKGHANTLRQIHSHQVLSLQQSMVISLFNTLNQSIRFLERTASDLSNKVSEVVAAVDAAQFLISQNATFVVNQETEKYKQTIIGYFRQYLDWIKTSVSTYCDINIVEKVSVTGGSLSFQKLNTFWFGLGCSTLFLLPSIILSVRLAKFYRRMDTEDVYDDIETIPMKTIPTYDTMTRFPRASAPPRQADW